MKANIRAQLIIVEGTVDGDLQADKSVFVKDTAKVSGNIYAPSVSISEGANFSGSIDMGGKKSGHAATAKPRCTAPRRGQDLRERGVTMAWFKKSDDGDSEMINPNSSGRPTAQEPMQHAGPSRASRASNRARRPPARRTPDRMSRVPRSRARRSRVRRKFARRRAHRARPCSDRPCEFRGELSAQEDLIIQGSVEGSITHTQSLTVGTDGTMKGDIRARVIVVDGKVEGDLYATESVSIRATAKVKGNVFAPRVGITEGAFFQGQVEMQPSGAAVQEHSARLRQAARHDAPRWMRRRSTR